MTYKERGRERDEIRESKRERGSEGQIERGREKEIERQRETEADTDRDRESLREAARTRAPSCKRQMQRCHSRNPLLIKLTEVPLFL